MADDSAAPDGLAGAVRALADAASVRGRSCGASPESMTVAGIVGAYCAALAVRAHAEAAARSSGTGPPGGGGGGARAAAAEALAAFDSAFHPRAMARLEEAADGIARRLESGGGAGGAAAEYDRLREAMSAAEFARQYDRGLRGT